MNQHLWLALARQEAKPILGAYAALPKIPDFCQWANFLRTHDELDLGRLSDDERSEVFQKFGTEPNMQLYNRGIRRRLAPMLNNDRRRIELAHSLLLTLPGTPVLRYGDEIGMGEDLSLQERDSIRTPMQWANAKNGGFSPVDPSKVVTPVLHGGDFGYERVNVADQQRDPESLLNRLERMTRLRVRSPEFGAGNCEWLDSGNPAVLAHCCDGQRSCVFAVHNLSDQQIELDLPLGRKVKGLFDLMKNCDYRLDGGVRQNFRLSPYGYLWIREGRGPESLSGVID
jgi:maltose alpha-D-glucosyltransferase/alpha-amylase